MDAAFEEIFASYARRLNGLSVECVEWHPGGSVKRWCPRQVVEHLMLTYRSSGNVFRERLEKGRPTKSRPTPVQVLRRESMLRIGRFPRRLEAPAMVTPGSEPATLSEGSVIAEALRQELQLIDELLNRCERVFADEPFATHQIIGPLSASQWRRFHLLHARHHLKQISHLQ